MASAKLRKKAGSDRFLSPEQTRTIKPGDFKHHTKLKDLSQDDLIELLSLMEAELQAKDVLLKAILSSEAGIALPLSHLLNDGALAKVEEAEDAGKEVIEEEEEVWLGEPSAHLNHVVAYHQVVREQMQSIVESLQKQHRQVVDQLDEERHKHAVETAQGDDVTYMLEKQKGVLTHMIDVEQAKYSELEKERDDLLKILEEERKEQYNTFNSLVNDCKAFALQLVQQSTKYQKDIDKEKAKNKLLSELMVEETQKFKEKLKQYEDQVSEYHLLEQKKTELEQKLLNLEKKYRETFKQLDEERLSNRKLTLHINQLRRYAPPDFNTVDDEGEDILYIQDKVEIPIKQAGISSITVSNKEERDSPEPTNIPPTTPHVQSVKIATVQKSACVKQNLTSPYSPKVIKSPAHPPPPPPSHVTSLNNPLNNPPSLNPPPLSLNPQPSLLGNHVTAPKRHSYEDRKHVFDYSCDEQPPHNTTTLHLRNSLENINTQQQTETFANPHPLRGSAPTMRHNSCEEVRNIGTGATEGPKRNSYEGESSTKKTPPPAPPPRRGSTLSSTEKTPVVKVPHQFQQQPRRSAPPHPIGPPPHAPQTRPGGPSGPKL